ncbi:MAG: DUF1566 domain-containing protein [Thermodesulfobacteriota bacterium]
MIHHPIIITGQIKCYDTAGNEIPCSGTGQDAAISSGFPWPSPRFTVLNDLVHDHLTDLYWTKDVNLAEFPLAWQEAFDFIREMNTEKRFGFDGWRLPNRRELQSLMSYQTKKPALPENHPFSNYYLGWYWTSTTSAVNTAYAWYIHLEGARMFYGRKDQYCFLWPVRGTGNSLLAGTGQQNCYDTKGKRIECRKSDQDGEFRIGAKWPSPRFSIKDGVVFDCLTNLYWLQEVDIIGVPVKWEEALASVHKLNAKQFLGIERWRLPNINELESLVDCSQHSPALPANHPFKKLRDTYWSSTSSFFETDWAWALYLDKGARGVGYKPDKNFYIWPLFS